MSDSTPDSTPDSDLVSDPNSESTSSPTPSPPHKADILSIIVLILALILVIVYYLYLFVLVPDPPAGGKGDTGDPGPTQDSEGNPVNISTSDFVAPQFLLAQPTPIQTNKTSSTPIPGFALFQYSDRPVNLVNFSGNNLDLTPTPATYYCVNSDPLNNGVSLSGEIRITIQPSNLVPGDSFLIQTLYDRGLGDDSGQQTRIILGNEQSLGVNAAGGCIGLGINLTFNQFVIFTLSNQLCDDDHQIFFYSKGITRTGCLAS